LHEAFAASWKIAKQFWLANRKAFKIDDIEVCFVSG
jgi:hypothetical protein